MEFTSAFKRQVDTVADHMGLINTTSPRQEKNGTISYLDPVVCTGNTQVSYILYESGYIRREVIDHDYKNGYHFGRERNIYQLNDVRIHKGTLGSPYYYERLYASPKEQLGILSHRVLSFREYVQKQND